MDHHASHYVPQAESFLFKMARTTQYIPNRNFLRGAKTSMRKCSCKAICMKPINWPPKCIKMLCSFGCFRAMLQNQGISREIVQNRTTRSKLRLLQHDWIFQGLWAIIHFTPLHPSFPSFILVKNPDGREHLFNACAFELLLHRS